LTSDFLHHRLALAVIHEVANKWVFIHMTCEWESPAIRATEEIGNCGMVGNGTPTREEGDSNTGREKETGRENGTGNVRETGTEIVSMKWIDYVTETEQARWTSGRTTEEKDNVGGRKTRRMSQLLKTLVVPWAIKGQSIPLETRLLGDNIIYVQLLMTWSSSNRSTVVNVGIS
jgi:hypothetical protein